MNVIIDGYCQCGCEQRTTIYRGKPRKFLAGHQARGANNARFGAKLTDDVKRKISVANKGKLAGENNPFYGKIHTLETRQLMSDKGKGVAKTPRRGKYKFCLFCDVSFYVSQS